MESKNCNLLEQRHADVEKLIRRVRPIVNGLDELDIVLGTTYEPQLLASRLFLECRTMLDMRFRTTDNFDDVCRFLVNKHNIKPQFIHGKPASYRWLLFH